MTLRRGADEVLYAPVEELIEESFVPNERGATARRKRSRKKRFFEEEALSLYDGHAGFLVRTAVIRADDYDDKDAPTIDSPEKVFRICQHLAYADQEHFVVLALDGRSRLRAIHETSIGATSSSLVTVQHVIKVPLLVSASAVIAVHNHPSESPQPSGADLMMTGKLAAGAKCIGITFADHLIIARRGFYSMRDNGDL